MDIFEQLSSQLDLNDPRQKTISLMKGIVLSIPDKKGQAYALARILNNPKFGLDKPEAFIGVDKDAWSLKHLEDYTPPDVESRERSEDEKSFWNWGSDRHWTKRGTEEMKRKARDYGYAVGDEPAYESKGYQKFLKEVSKAQTAKDRQKIYDENAMIGTKILYPRMTEKVLKGEDIDMEKDFFLDMLEQGLYATNPAERLLGTLKAPMMATKWGGAVANPLAMESFDAAAYNGEDTDRAKFSPIDVGVGTLINRGVGKATERLNVQHMPKLPKEHESAASIANREKFIDKWENKNAVIDDWMKQQQDQAAMGNIKQAENLDYAILEKLIELVNYGSVPEKEFAKTALKARAKRQAKNLLPNAIDFTSNKFGDVISEDPKRTRRVARQAFGPAGFFFLPQINDMLEAYYRSDEKNKEKEKIDKDLKQLELIYGLQDWRNE